MGAPFYVFYIISACMAYDRSFSGVCLFFGSVSVYHYFVRCPAHVPMPGFLIHCYSSLCVPVYHSDMVLYACIFLYSRKIMAAFVGSWPSSFYPLSFLLLYSYMPVVPSIVFMFTVYDECPPQELSRSSLWWTLLIILMLQCRQPRCSSCWHTCRCCSPWRSGSLPRPRRDCSVRSLFRGNRSHTPQQTPYRL